MMSIQVKVVRGNGDKEAPSIADDLIVTDSMAVSRGKRFLDDINQGQYYPFSKRTFKVPHKSSSVYPSKWIQVSDSRLGMDDNTLKVTSYTISIERTGVWVSMETCEFLEPES